MFKNIFKKILCVGMAALITVPTIISFAGSNDSPDYSAFDYRFAIKKVWDDDNDKYNQRPDSVDFKVCYYKQIDEENYYFTDFEKIQYDEEELKSGSWDPETRLLTLEDGNVGIPVYMSNTGTGEPSYWYLLKIEKDNINNIDLHTQIITLEDETTFNKKTRFWADIYFPLTSWHGTGDAIYKGYDLIRENFDSTLPEFEDEEFQNSMDYFFEGYQKYIEEVVPDGYVAANEYLTSDIDHDLFCFVNISTKNEDIQINKTWDDDNNRDGLRPDTITLIGYECYVYNGKYYYFNYDEKYDYHNLPFNTQYELEDGKILASGFVLDGNTGGEGYYLLLEDDVFSSDEFDNANIFGDCVLKPCVLVADGPYDTLTGKQKELVHTYEITVSVDEDWTKITEYDRHINHWVEKSVKGYSAEINEGAGD